MASVSTEPRLEERAIELKVRWFESTSVIGIFTEVFRLAFLIIAIVWLFMVKFVIYIGGPPPTPLR